MCLLQKLLFVAISRRLNRSSTYVLLAHFRSKTSMYKNINEIHTVEISKQKNI